MAMLETGCHRMDAITRAIQGGEKQRMTREELKAHCEKQVEMCEMRVIGKGEKPSGKIYEEHKLILELLEQKPCDAVSREAVLDAIITLWADKPFGNPALTEIKECVERVPSVTPICEEREKGECPYYAG